MFLDPGNMSIEELEEYIQNFPTNSACDRARIEKLKELLESKKLIQSQNEEV